MIEITDKKDCMGCNACTEICPVDCIPLIPDEESFLYPKIDHDICIDCPLCDRVCPITNKLPDESKLKPILEKIRFDRFEKLNVYGAYTNDAKLRLESTSGGIFSELAKEILNAGGYVVGAKYDLNYRVVHDIIDTLPDLDHLRSSKYVLSEINGIYSEVENKLKNGSLVLFSGAPCQISGLYSYLKKEYQNLITCDFVCKGVNSPKVWENYLKTHEANKKSRVTYIKAKDKTEGWHKFSMRINFENGEVYQKNRFKDPFFRGYLETNLFTMPACFDCKFKGVNQKADITLADFWGIERIDQDMDQDKGTSLILIRSEKGQNYFETIKPNITWKQYSLEDAIPGNPAILYSDTEGDPEIRRLFYKDLEILDFNEISDKYFPEKSITQKLQIQLDRVQRLLLLLKEIILNPTKSKKAISNLFPTLFLKFRRNK